MEISKYIAEQARTALMTEVLLTPKPGLVDQANCGSHHDMTIATFEDSIDALVPFFEQYFLTGYYHERCLASLFNPLRVIGKQAEKAMMVATAGVNTHKGANFSFAVFLGALGYYYQKYDMTIQHQVKVSIILKNVKAMCCHLVEQDFQGLSSSCSLSHGERLYMSTGQSGIRGEAAGGYQTLSNLLLPYFKTCRLAKKEKYLRGLILLMAELEDSNLYHRGGDKGIRLVQFEARRIAQSNLKTDQLFKALSHFDQLLIAHHLSPGGSADLLALGIFIDLLENSSFI